MNNYTVLLLRPDYIAAQFGEDTYLAHVIANGPEAAMETGQDEARDADKEDDDQPLGDPTDYAVLFVCLGHQQDLTVR